MTDDRLFKKGKKENTEDQIWKPVPVYLPVSIHKKLEEEQERTGTPKSRLIAKAIDNELDSRNPFNYPCDLPEIQETDGALYLREGRKILDFLLKLPGGTAVESLVVARRDVGVDDKELLLKALVELIQKDLVEFYKSKVKLFGYNPGQLYVRAKNGDGSQQKSRFKKFEGVSLKGVRTLKDDDIDRGEE